MLGTVVGVWAHYFTFWNFKVIIAGMRIYLDTCSLQLLYKQLGAVNTIRFLQQFTNGLGNYTEEREVLFADQTLDDLVKQIKERRQRVSSGKAVT